MSGEVLRRRSSLRTGVKVGRRVFEPRSFRSLRSLQSLIRIFAFPTRPPHASLAHEVLAGWVREKWAGADVEPRQTCSLRCARLTGSNLPGVHITPTTDASLSLGVAKWGENGPAQIRTAVTATRRPKDTKLPHRPAYRTSPLGFLTLPNGRRRRRARPGSEPDADVTGRSRLEVPVPVAATPRVERRAARGTRVVVGLRPTARGTPSLVVAVEIRPSRVCRATDATQDRRIVEPSPGPRLGVVGGGVGVAGVTRRERAAAPEPECHDVDLGVPVSTPGVGVDRDSAERDRKAAVGGRGGRCATLPAASPVAPARTLGSHRQYAVYPSVSR